VPKKKRKSKLAGPETLTAPEEALFGWREPRKRAICRPSSAYRFLADLNGVARPNLFASERYLYLGATPNRPGYCAAMELSTGRLITENHPEDFEELPVEDAENGPLGPPKKGR
jgi:hypothetical protein